MTMTVAATFLAIAAGIGLGFAIRYAIKRRRAARMIERIMAG